jgi:hypothetical protein
MEHFNSPDEAEAPNKIWYSVNPDQAGGVNDRSGEQKEAFLTDFV